VAERPRIEETCFWLSRRELPDVEQAPAERRTRFAVIGAGFTGLWVAHFLRELCPDAAIVVVERGRAGQGASGRNAGIVGSCLDHSHGLAVAHFGHDEAQRLANLGLDNFAELARYATDCDFELTGQYHVALSEQHVAEGVAAAAAATSLGLAGHRCLSAAEIRAAIASPLYLGAHRTPMAGIIDPVRLVQKLRAEAVAGGVRFLENTPVLGFDGHHPVLASGRLETERTILATDAYSHLLVPGLLHRYMPLYDYVIVSEPLNPRQLAAIGWGGREAVTDGRNFFNYYRLTADNRILWGTSEAKYFRGNRVDDTCDESAEHFAELRASFCQTFPQLVELAFPYAWGGPIASTTRLTPFFGTLASGRLHYALGYTGHGIASARLAGRITAHLVLERSSELLLLDMVKKKPFPLPPEPFRSLAIDAVTSSLKAVDRGERKSLLLRLMDALGIGFSS
jgi:glycine/D-amino acid oxidase-like deaminating enzyme